MDSRRDAPVRASDVVAETPSWEIRMLLERARELETLKRYEEALVLYHRGRRRAPLVKDFEEGVHRAELAVDACLGPGADALFADMPALLPDMIEEQRGARALARQAARARQERRRAAVRAMAFSDAGPANEDSEADDEVGEEAGQLVPRQDGGVLATRTAGP